LTAILQPGSRQPATVLHEPAVVLVDPVLNGHPFKAACAESGYAVASVYTLAPEELHAMAPGHQAGDAISLYGSDPGVLGSRLASAVTDVRAIVPATEPATHVAALLAQRWTVPGNSAAVARARRDKTAMRQLAARTGLPIPRFEVATPGGVAAAARRIGLPVIVKPPTGAGAHNVQLITDETQLAGFDGRHHRDLFGNPVSDWLVEEYVRGQEFAVNTFSFDGHHTIIDVWEYQQLDSDDYDFPYQDFLQAEPDPGITSFALDVLRAFEISVGPAHIEIKVGSGGPVLIEIGARLPGAGIPVTWHRHGDFRPYHDTLAAHLGSQPELMRRPPAFDACVGMTFIRNDGPPGVLRGLGGLADIGRLAGVDAVHVRASVGDRVPTSDHLGSELVKIELSAPSYRELRLLASTVRQLISVRIDPAYAAA
jgi:biotin carboxylase